MEAAGDMVGGSDCCEIVVVAVAACINSAADDVVSSDFPSVPVRLWYHSLLRGLKM